MKGVNSWSLKNSHPPSGGKGVKKMGKQLLSHRYNLLPLLCSHPGGVQRELIVKDLPGTKVEKGSVLQKEICYFLRLILCIWLIVCYKFIVILLNCFIVEKIELSRTWKTVAMLFGKCRPSFHSKYPLIYRLVSPPAETLSEHFLSDGISISLIFAAIISIIDCINQ